MSLVSNYAVILSIDGLRLPRRSRASAASSFSVAREPGVYSKKVVYLQSQPQDPKLAEFSEFLCLGYRGLDDVDLETVVDSVTKSQT